MLLRTFGGLSLEADAADGPIPSIGPRRLALLALVAATGARGITREKILGILWAETEEEQARHTLSQTLYLLRRETGRDWIAGTSLLRLDPSIKSDVGDFHEALATEDLARAAARYTGPFLEGFYLAGAPEFEQWVEEMRARLQFAALKALETLARRASEAGAVSEALNWWRRLSEIDPFSSSYAAGQIRALIASGDQAAALRFARHYEWHIQRELDTAPDPAISELIAALRSPRKEPITGPFKSSPTLPALSAPQATTAALETTESIGPPPARRSWKVWVSAAVVAGALVAAVSWTLTRRPSAESLPFLAIGFIQSRDTGATGPVLRDMLATNLARLEGMRVVSNSRLLELLPSGENAPIAIADAARRAGASELVEGELGTLSNGLVLTLRRVALQSGLVRQGYSVRARDAYALIDSATAAIAQDLRLDPPPNAVATVRTRSAVAYALYEEGLRALYGGDPASAHRLMDAALERDSTFAMAAYYAWMSARITHRYDDAARLLPVVNRLATRAIDRERLIIQSTVAREDRPVVEFLPLAREAATRYPDDPDAQITFGSALGVAGDWAGAASAYNRAIAIDSAAGAVYGSYCRVCTAIHLMSGVYLWWDSLAAAERTERRLIAFRPKEGSAWSGPVEALLRQGRRREAEAAIAKASSVSAIRGNIAPTLDRDLIRSGRLDEMEVSFVSKLRSAEPDVRNEMPWLLAIGLRNQGRLREARMLAEQGIVPGGGFRLAGHKDEISLAIIALEAGQPREAARRFLAMEVRDRAIEAGAGFIARNRTWHLTLAATALSAAGDTAAVRALVDTVMRVGAMSSFGRDFKLHFFLRGLLLQHENRHAEAVEAFRHALFSVTEGYTRTNLEMARSLMALRRYVEAIAILQPAMRGGVDGSNTYVTFSELHYMLAKAFEGAGQQDSAAVHYTAVERAWRRADPQFANRYREAKAKAALRM